MPERYTDRERRKYPRLKEKIVLIYKLAESAKIRSSATKDISGGGVCFETAVPASPGDIIWVKINKPAPNGSGQLLTVYTFAQVRWAKRIAKRRYELGVEFTDMKEKDRNQIISYVLKKLRE